MTVNDVLTIAAAELGYTEYPPDSNNTKYGEWYGMNYNPWCMMFVQWCFAQAGSPLPYKTASCSALERWYRSNRPDSVHTDPAPGDIAIYNFGHTGIVESVSGSKITAIEGNTSSTDYGSQDNGGGVYRKTRNKSLVTAFIRPDYAPVEEPEEETEDEDEVVRYERLSDIPEANDFRAIVNDLMTAKIINGDGSDPGGNNDIIDLSHDMVRMLVFEYRAGVYDNAIEAAGLDPSEYK